jgi:hypothetical protein
MDDEVFRDLERRFYEDEEASTVFSEEGFPTFEHNQYTVEGEIERFHHFGMAGARATGWKRAVALLIVVSFFAPLLLSAAVVVLRLL